MNLRSFNWAALAIGISAIAIVGATAFAIVWVVINPATPLEIARDNFVITCERAQGVANVGSDNSKEWTCGKP